MEREFCNKSTLTIVAEVSIFYVCGDSGYSSVMYKISVEVWKFLGIVPKFVLLKSSENLRFSDGFRAVSGEIEVN